METLDDLAEDWAAMKLRPDITGLPMAVWITENDGYPHDARVKVATIHGGRGSWRASPSVTVRPDCREVRRGSLPTSDVGLVRRWVELNRDVIIDFWDGAIDDAQVRARLRRI